MTNEEREDVQRMEDHYILRHGPWKLHVDALFRRMLVAQIVAYVILGIGVVAGFLFIDRQNELICSVANDNRDAMRGILIDANERAQTSLQRTPEEKAAAQLFYTAQLQRIPPNPCSDK
jgi:hypothetical protein